MRQPLTKRRLKGIRKAFEERARRSERMAHRAAPEEPSLRQPVLRLLAPNLDQLVVGVSCEGELRTGLLDRLLVLAQLERVAPLVVFTKVDLLSDRRALDACLGLYRGLGFPSLATSSQRGDGLEELRALLQGRVSALCGHSGVGKSSLMRALDPALSIEVGAVSPVTGKGCHTTTTVRLWRLEGGISLFDLPGLKEAPVPVTSELADCFPEFTAPARRCRFADCSHSHEPDCAVRAALDQGLIDERRYRSYLRMLEG